MHAGKQDARAAGGRFFLGPPPPPHAFSCNAAARPLLLQRNNVLLLFQRDTLCPHPERGGQSSTVDRSLINSPRSAKPATPSSVTKKSHLPRARQPLADPRQPPPPPPPPSAVRACTFRNFARCTRALRVRLPSGVHANAEGKPRMSRDFACGGENGDGGYRSAATAWKKLGKVEDQSGLEGGTRGGGGWRGRRRGRARQRGGFCT